jgi:hypothetical protein
MESMKGARRSNERRVPGPGRRARALGVALLGAVLAVAFTPRGSGSLGTLCETSRLVLVGRVGEPVPRAPAGRAWRVSIETVLKGKPPRGGLTVWIPDFDAALKLEREQRALFFLSPVPDRPLFRRMRAVGLGLWRVEGSSAGVADPALAPEAGALIGALRSDDRRAILEVLIVQAAHGDVRVRRDAAEDLERRCPNGCALDGRAHARLRALAGAAPQGSDVRRSLFRAAGEADPVKGEEAP